MHRYFMRGLPLAVLTLTCLHASPALAGKKARAKAAVPSGTPTASMDESGGYARLDTVREVQNAAGQTVYSVSASHFDVSAPLRELAKTERLEQAVEEEGPENEELPDFRKIRSSLPDPVVQPAPQGTSFAAPATGFNFLALGTNGLTPSDSNGSVGNSQYVETVNTRYQVWSLNRATNTPTSLVGPVSINTLWSGFGGPCQAQNAGDPIVLYDKLANRWLISQFTTTLSSGFYYQCVALSTTPDATGTYFRWAFAVPGGVFGDYPHFGAWQDAYYMMAHAFTSTSGSYVAALFAAMDRTKMLAGDPTATWQVLSDPLEGGHMPADLDGFAPPPTGAPGIFLSWNPEGMVVYRMKVDFNVPANTVRTVQATVPIAPASGACGGGGSCIPQPGTTVRVGSLADRLMFRAAYRNFIDHETIVVSHSVDPAVTGLVSGVRWYDIRLSGAPDATCASYPCMRQQGTIADVANGRSRWMSSLAMDGAENLLVGYSTTGQTAGTDNHSLRYTGRGKNDPLGTMTAPEATIVTGTANNTNSRWGDYSSMSADPFDDCTLWYVGQYFTTAGAWSTRVASATFPAGSGNGQCQPLACTSRPATAPTIGAASAPADNQVQVTWAPAGGFAAAYAVERAEGTCASPGLYQPVGWVGSAQTSFTDTTVQGGLTYAYRVRASSDAGGRCQNLTASACVQVTATGTCNLKPTFAGVQSASSSDRSSCGVEVIWNAGASRCPLTPNLRYNVFRGTVPDFVPALANRIATCVTSPGGYLDDDNLTSGVTYYYAVRAEDTSLGNGGECGGGNEEANSAVTAGTAYGPGLQNGGGTWTDGGGDTTAFLRLNVPEPGDTADQLWRFVRTVDDAGANHTPGGGYAYRNAGPTAAATTGANQCAEMQTPSLTVAGGTLQLQYWERHQLEYHWDGVAVEYSVNGGPWQDVPAPSNNPGNGCAATDDVTGWEALSCTQNPPINACGYPASKLAFTGPLGGGTTCNDFAPAPMTAYAHRCHPLSGLAAGDSVRFRWRFTSDPGTHLGGFYLDDVAVTQTRLPNTCTANTCGTQPDGSPCNDGSACTTADVCDEGSCAGTPGSAPPETAGLVVTGAAGTTLSWTAAGPGAVYDVAGATLTTLQGGGTASAACLSNDGAAASFLDGRPDPAAGAGYYYLVRAQNVCGPGTYGFNSASVERVLPAACP